MRFTGEKISYIRIVKYRDVEIKMMEKDEMYETTAQMYTRIR